jgi:hypothetical protein
MLQIPIWVQPLICGSLLAAQAMQSTSSLFADRKNVRGLSTKFWWHRGTLQMLHHGPHVEFLSPRHFVEREAELLFSFMRWFLHTTEDSNNKCMQSVKLHPHCWHYMPLLWVIPVKILKNVIPKNDSKKRHQGVKLRDVIYGGGLRWGRGMGLGKIFLKGKSLIGELWDRKFSGSHLWEGISDGMVWDWEKYLCISYKGGLWWRGKP